MRTKLSVVLALLLLLGTCAAAEPSASSRSPTTGLPSNAPYRPVLVQISNTPEARPAIGFSSADIVYESIYWGPAHTRYLALFSDTHPEIAGPIRSSRIFFNELREMWDSPYVFWGAQGSVTRGDSTHAFFKNRNVPEAMLFDGTRTYLPEILARTKDRISPHNAIVYLKTLVENHWPLDADGAPFEPRLPGLRFGGDFSKGGETALSMDIIYEADNYAARYIFDEASGHYIRWYNGVPQADAGGTQITASNVLVQYVWLSYYNNSRSLPIIKTTGSGPLDIFIGGTHIRGTWVRDEMDDFVRYLDGNGNELILMPGKTFVQMVPMEMTIAYTDAEGNTHTLGAEAK